jgi:hypothetical protein
VLHINILADSGSGAALPSFVALVLAGVLLEWSCFFVWVLDAGRWGVVLGGVVLLLCVMSLVSVGYGIKYPVGNLFLVSF